MSNLKLRTWRIITGIIFLIAPFTPWATSPYPDEPPGSLVYVIYTFWQDTLEYMNPQEIIIDTFLSLVIVNMLFLGYLTLTKSGSKKLHMASLAFNYLFIAWMLYYGISGVAWGIWVYFAGILSATLYFLFTHTKTPSHHPTQISTSA